MNVLKDERTKIPIKMWLDDIEDGALQQAINLSNLPFAFKHIAIMPDSHQGYGMPIGGVLATKGVIIPHAVGSDIGCGMCAVKTPWTINDIWKFDLKLVIKEIRNSIPVGFKKHKHPQHSSLMPSIDLGAGQDIICNRQYTNALKQLGTLGGGNHFIELQKDSKDNIWVMLHSGSRKLGYDVADYYNNLAIKMNKQWHVGVPTNHQLAYFPIDSREGILYKKEMDYCIEYAFINRRIMMEKIKEAFDTVINWKTIDLSYMINIAHNYAQWENHFGENVIIHRKGATLAREGQLGIIPGSQGTKSYIVRGKGNLESFMSCSHGAGRAMSRTKARNELNLEDEIKKMDDKGIIHSLRSKNSLEESDSAYKSIDVVMENQKDLIDIVEELTPLAVIKG